MPNAPFLKVNPPPSLVSPRVPIKETETHTAQRVLFGGGHTQNKPKKKKKKKNLCGAL
eukprot:NODE_4910_length_544_cov_3235.654545_g3599_i0.p3 GENE.NODE_4910_length_544_cov_3235.654545_g3599_i0~~NODE_4910_length_544_cov_3235.654545_g3599_i0.p3  ORF type:complete len:58 (-),score=10.20 NODE_4910_length_544_cov_3235.654545_g3599_i0:220-393(-)